MSQPASAGSGSRSCIFYKLIVPSIIHEKQLRIPEKFIRRFGDELSTVARLTVPNGRIWLVGLKKDQTKIWFCNGWQDFIEHYSIRVGYILVFKYEGLSNFKVQVFNLPTSELNYQCKGRNSSEEPNYSKHYHLFEEMEDDDSIENVGSSSPFPTPASVVSKARDGRVDQLTLGMSYNPPTAAQNTSNGLGPKLKNSVNLADEEDWPSSKVDGNPHGPMLSRNGYGVKVSCTNDQIQRPKYTKRKRKLDGNDQESEHGGEGDMQFILSNRPPPSSVRIATAEERERALSASKTFDSANPFCRVVLRPSYLYRGCIMYLPSCFAGKHLSGVSGFIKLQDPVGKQWPVRYLYKGGGARLGRGWYDFSLGNNLEEGDVCVFELINMYDVVLKVSIFHVLGGASQVNQQPSQYNGAPRSVRF